MPHPNAFTPLERAVLDWIAQHQPDEALRQQLREAELDRREWTGTGFTVYLQVPPDMEPAAGVNWPINGPALESDDIDIAGDSMLWGDGGYATYLELFSFGEFFNEDVRDFRIVAFEE